MVVELIDPPPPLLIRGILFDLGSGSDIRPVVVNVSVERVFQVLNSIGWNVSKSVSVNLVQIVQILFLEDRHLL